MSEKRSFWAGVPGLVTGLAGLLTGIVGLVTLLVQLDVIGGDDSSPVATTGTTVAVAGGGGGTATTQAGTFSLSPSPLNFGLTDSKEKTIAVRNTGDTRLTVQTPRVTGKDAERFTPSLGDCAGGLAPNLSCTIRVTFAPSGPLRTYEATLQVIASEARSGAEVKVTASTLL